MQQPQVQELLLLQQRVEQLEQQHLQEQSTHQVENHQQLQAQYELQKLQVERLQIQVEALVQEQKHQSTMLSATVRYTIKLSEHVQELITLTKELALRMGM
jgi:glutamine synthetase type III